VNIIRFSIYGVPVPKGRPRFYRAGKYIGTYTPKNTRKWEEFVRFQALQYRPKEVPECAIEMELLFLIPRPKSLPKKVKYHIKKPDIENLAKSILDALQGIFYRNDSQIYKLSLIKEYSTERYGVEITIKYEMKK